MEQHRQYIEEDEIDLKELWKTIVKRKIFIFLFTTIVTVLAIIWALTRTP
ncbi:MAG TPA: chain-length determining protein, partial [Arcobacter sp.]|nr:chain-length determining protein [Arcobacter sp.]